jgi:hypothetical protein
MRTQYAGRLMAPVGHSGTTADKVRELVAQVGPVVGLYRLEEAEACAHALADAARERGQHATAAGLDAAAVNLRRQQFELVERFS